MATFTATRAAATFPVFESHQSGLLCVAWGAITVAAAPADGDIYQMCRVPAGATVLGGYVQADDLDTGTEALDMDVGWAANGVEAADPDGFGNLGTWTGDVVANLRPEVGNYYPLGGVLITTGPQTFSNETIIQVECNTAPGTFTAGPMSLVVHYVTG